MSNPPFLNRRHFIATTGAAAMAATGLSDGSWPGAHTMRPPEAVTCPEKRARSSLLTSMRASARSRWTRDWKSRPDFCWRSRSRDSPFCFAKAAASKGVTSRTLFDFAHYWMTEDSR